MIQCITCLEANANSGRIGTISTAYWQTRKLTTRVSETTDSILVKLRVYEQIVTNSQYHQWGYSAMSGGFLQYRKLAAVFRPIFDHFLS